MTNSRPMPAFTERDIEKFWARVEKADGCWLWAGGKGRRGYGIFRVGERCLYAHRVSHFLTNGVIPAGLVIDHICHNPTCVRPAHLRAATVKQNLENLSGLRADNTSGHRGVHFEKSTQRWRGDVMHQQKSVSVGRFDSKQECIDAVTRKRLELFTHNEVDKAKGRR